MKVAFIFHGKLRGKAKVFRELDSTFANIQHEIFFTDRVGAAEPLTAYAALNGFSHVVVCGGDGSLNEAVNGLIKLQDNSLDALPCLGILPFGTGNDFIKTSGSPHDFLGLRQCLNEGKNKSIDIAYASLHDDNGGLIERYFINIAEVGIGGTIAFKMSGASKVFGATLTFQYHILTTLLTYGKSELTINAAGNTYSKPMMNLVIANGRFFAGGLCVSPDSDIEDGKLDIVQIGNVSTLDYVKNLPQLKKEQRINHPEVSYYSVKEISVTADCPMPVDMDGEFAGLTPLKIKLLPKALKFIC